MLKWPEVMVSSPSSSSSSSSLSLFMLYHHHVFFTVVNSINGMVIMWNILLLLFVTMNEIREKDRADGVYGRLVDVCNEDLLVLSANSLHPL